jgi:hypothetical protein
MKYNKLISVSGLPGLFELLNSKTDGAIVKSLQDASTKFVSSRVHNFSHLESIEVYTTGENVNLVDVFTAIKAAGIALPNESKPEDVKKYFAAVYPTMDFERVYASDMKKMVKWYAILADKNIDFSRSEEPETVDVPTANEATEKTGTKTKKKEVVEEATVTEEPKKVTKKAAPKKATTNEVTTAEEPAPKKVAVKKKKAED